MLAKIYKFPTRFKPQMVGLFSENEFVAGRHMVFCGKAKFVPVKDLPLNKQVNSLGERAAFGIEVQGHAVNEFHGLCAYLLTEAREGN